MGTAAKRSGLVALCLGVLLVLGGAASAAAPDNALQFDGTDDYVTFGQATSTLGATQFTLETWFMRAGTGGTPMGTGTGGLTNALPLVTKGRGEGETPANLNTNYFLGLDSATNKLVADFEDTATGLNHPALPATGTLVATPNVWHHAAATYDGTTWRLYLDGKLDRAVNVGNFTPESTSIQHAAIGSALTSTGVPGTSPGFFAGQLDEVRIWNVVRTGAQIRANKDSETPTPTTGLRGHWSLDEGSGPTTGDSSGQNVTGTLTNGPVWIGGYTFPQDTSAPAQVQNLTATPGNTTVGLGWSANGESDLAGYNVYRALTTPVPTGGTPLNGDDLLQTTSFNDSGLTNGTTYHYALVAVDGSNNPSASAEVPATPSSGTGTGPVGDWRVNEGSGTTLVDSSGSGNNGSILGNPTWVPGQHGSALRLDGTGDYATVPDSGSLDVSGAITMAAWVRPEKTATQYLIKKAQTGTNGYELSLANTGKVFVRFNQTTSANLYRIDSLTSYPVDGSTWMHVAATYDGSLIRLYVNGVQEGSALAGPASIATNNLALGIGAQPDGVSQLQGALDDVLVYNSALSASEVAALAAAPGNTPPTLNPVGNKNAQVGTQLAFTATASDPDVGDTLSFSLAPGSGGSVPAGASITTGGAFTWTPTAGQVGPATFDVCVSDGTASDCETITVTVSPAGAATPVGDWRVNEGSGTTLVDSSGSGNNGSILGNPTWVPGQHGSALRLDGTGDYATVPDSGSLDVSGAITMAAWVRPEKTATQYLIKKATQGGTSGYELSLSSAGKVFVRFNQATNMDAFRINSLTSYPVNGSTWMHVAATYDGSTIRLYVNGMQEGGDLAGPASIATNNLALGIGAQPDGVSQLQGALDDVLVYNSALSASEVAALAAAPGNTPPTLNPVGNKNAQVGTQLAFTATASDPDVGDTLSFSLAPGSGGSVPAGASITTGGAFTWTPTAGQVGPATFDVCVSDGTASDCETITVTVSAAGADLVLVGAGDIANCSRTQDSDTAALVSAIPGNVFTIGDNAYETGTAAEFGCYDDTWGAFKGRTRPAAGNHDFGNGATPGATPYFDYFNGVGNQTGPAGDRALGYYSYDIGAGPNTWHVVVLNSECEPSTGYWLPGGCAAGSAQDLWLKADLANAPTNNIIAIWHKPRWSSSGNHAHMQQLWQDLYDGGADILLGGHWHNYERLAPMDGGGAADPDFGVRQFVVGTGGAALSGFGTILPTSQVRNSSTDGVIKFTLHQSSYDWEFVPIAGQTFTDSGTASVHAAPGAGSQTFTTIPVTDSTGEKPQSKLWQHAGTWWAVLPTTAVSPAGTWIWRLNPDDTWSNVVQISNDTDVQADAKAVGAVTHILLHGPSPKLISVQYNATGNTYEPWSSRPAATPISLPNSEIATIDLDSTGRMWLATENGANLNVYYSDAPYTSFSGPITLANNIDDDDIGVVTALPNGTVGVLWSNQNTQRFGFKVHVDGQAPATWSADEVPASGSALNVGLGMADDHLNVAVAADGTLYAAVKTSYDTAGYPKIALLVRRPNGTWDPLYEVDQSGTRGIVLLNEQDQTVRVVYTSSEGFNDIVTKKSSTSTIAFGSRSTLITGGVNDVTSTKQNWTARVPVMASSASTAFTAFITADATVAGTVANDFDGDGDTDVAVYRPSDGVWYIKDQPYWQWGGQAGDVPVPGDYDGDGDTDVAIYRPSDGVWYIKDQPYWQWGGQAGDVPVPGDYDGDGDTDLAIYRPSEGVWYIKDQPYWQWGGQAGDVPVPGDYDGDGDTDLAIYRPSDGVWYIKDQPYWQWGGQAGDVPVPGDYDGDGDTDVAIYRPSEGVWYIKDQPYWQWGGQAGDVPVPGDYDGDGDTDLAIYRPSEGVWYIKDQPSWQWGQTGDVALSIPAATRLAYYP